MTEQPAKSRRGGTRVGAGRRPKMDQWSRLLLGLRLEEMLAAHEANMFRQRYEKALAKFSPGEHGIRKAQETVSEEQDRALAVEKKRMAMIGAAQTVEDLADLRREFKRGGLRDLRSYFQDNVWGDPNEGVEMRIKIQSALEALRRSPGFQRSARPARAYGVRQDFARRVAEEYGYPATPEYVDVCNDEFRRVLASARRDVESNFAAEAEANAERLSVSARNARLDGEVGEDD